MALRCSPTMLDYTLQNLPPLPVPFYNHIECTAKFIKITKRSRKTILFLPGYSRFYGLI